MRVEYDQKEKRIRFISTDEDEDFEFWLLDCTFVHGDKVKLDYDPDHGKFSISSEKVNRTYSLDDLESNDAVIKAGLCLNVGQDDEKELVYLGISGSDDILEFHHL